MILLLRHGQTGHNRDGILQGQIDAALSDLGRAQARRAGACLAALVGSTPVRVFSSPLSRCMETASLAVSALPGPPAIGPDERLKELSLGRWEGMRRDTVDAENPGLRQRLRPGEWLYQAPGGERMPAFRARLAAALDVIRAAGPGPRIVVSHGLAGRVIRGLHAGLDDSEMLGLDVPQDALFVLHDGGGIERVAYPD